MDFPKITLICKKYGLSKNWQYMTQSAKWQRKLLIFEVQTTTRASSSKYFILCFYMKIIRTRVQSTIMLRFVKGVVKLVLSASAWNKAIVSYWQILLTKPSIALVRSALTFCTIALILVYSIRARPPVLTREFNAVINVCIAQLSSVSWCALTSITARNIATRGNIETWWWNALINIIFAVESLVTLRAYADIVINQVVACTIVETRLLFTIINIGLTLFGSVSRLTSAQEVVDEVITRRIVLAGVGVALINFW